MRRWLLLGLLLAGRSQAAETPRLTGTLIGPDARTALFAAPGGTIPVGIGDHVGDYLVSRIDPGRVRLDAPDRHVVVSVEAATAPAQDPGGATFGLVLRQPGPADD